MQKWIMSGLFFAACTIALVLMFTLPGKEEVAEEEKPSMPAVTLDAGAAETLVKANCISCHGDQLEGAVGPNLQKIGTTMSAEQIYNTVSKGSGIMPAFKGQLKDEEIAHVALWLSEKK
ncbi:MAG TPA: cytochrome c [Paenibacillus sp.]|jgi:cytochrome c550